MITRFAPSPTGPLHLGHAYSALLAYDLVRANGGRFLLRIEDIDQTRARPQWQAQIIDDLTWLGITWDGPVQRQSDRLHIYKSALEELWNRDLIYPCTCRRKDILEALGAPQEGVTVDMGPDGPIYPGTCRSEVKNTGPLPDEALRLNMARALEVLQDKPLSFVDFHLPAHEKIVPLTHKDLIRHVGDIVLSRRDFPGSYHLSVVLDDAEQGVTHVVRGADLRDATQIHVVLQRLFDLPTPRYHHHRLIRDAAGKRLAKRDDARAIAKYRAEGATPDDIRAMVGL